MTPKTRSLVKKYAHYLERLKYDYEAFNLMRVCPQNKTKAVCVFRAANFQAKHPWSIKYRGRGDYFETKEQLDIYCIIRGFKGWDRIGKSARSMLAKYFKQLLDQALTQTALVLPTNAL
ncbi:hypothetical protein R83H12_02647 [Fibrobacteria bacterium R8-3-H12]